MGIFLGLIGMLGVPVCLVWLIVCFFRSTPKKLPLIGMLACVVLFFGGVALDMSGDKTPSNGPESLETDIDVSAQSDSDAEEDGQEPPEPPIDSDGGPLQSGVYELTGGVKLRFYDSVQNDVTGTWRLSKTASTLSTADFALAYYETMFSSDDEIHAVWNTELNTTTRISASSGSLFVDTFEYINGEEKDASLLFSGTHLDSRTVNLATGDVAIEEPEDSEPEQTSEPVPEPEPEQTPPAASSQPPAVPSPNTEQIVTPAPSQPASSNGASGGNGNNFNTYDNEEQQQTENKWVLNTSTMKIHYPTCREVKKIAPQNYSTSNSDESELIKQGYTTCGVCHK